jgi:hypothetical protein
MIVYRLTPYPFEEKFDFMSTEPPIPQFPTKRDLVENVAWRARMNQVPYHFQLGIIKYYDRRYHNIEAPLTH